ncbi:patatin-like phospholipase family protein [Kitasatospora sp. NPDC085895]|uniref:patatin-like phospholipase family protein n=1 Tax=Kitasatospora sp. NPDC085895 TaxID=3155057 RepID=UPI00344EA32E
MTDRKSLVLGGGGLAGIAWLTGLLAGFEAEGVAVAGTADQVVGTSAGSTVAGQLASGLPLAELYRRQSEPPLQNAELTPDPATVATLTAVWGKLVEETVDPLELRRAVCEMALAAETVSEPARREVIEGRLPRHDWPAWPLTLVAVDAGTAEEVLIDRESGVGLVDAVAASCAVPGIWPPVSVDGSRYVDGGVRSSANADLAEGGRVLVLAPLPDEALTAQVAALEARGAAVLAVTPDEASAAAFGVNPLDPAVRTPAAAAGLAQGRRIAARVAEVWGR